MIRIGKYVEGEEDDSHAGRFCGSERVKDCYVYVSLSWGPVCFG